MILRLKIYNYVAKKFMNGRTVCCNIDCLFCFKYGSIQFPF